MSNTRLVLFAAFIGSVFMACPPPSKADGGTGGGGNPDECFEDVDCPDPRFFFCNTTTSKCEPSCRTKSNCTAAERGEYKLDECEVGLGCQCDEQKCVPGLCGSDSDCGTTNVCRNGACVAPPGPGDVDHCLIVPDKAVLKGGTTQRFTAFAFNATNDPLIPKEGATWTGGMVAPATGNSTVLTAPMAPGMTTLTATFGMKTCTATIEALDPAVAATELAVVVTDELTGRGIPGATVVVSDPTTGAQIAMGGPTPANGYLKLTPVAGAEVNVTVFSSQYNYLTIANYDMTGSRFVSMVLRRHQNDKYGGQKGTFTGVPMTSNVHAALSGMSIAGSITDLSLAQLLGNTVPTDVKIGNAVDQKGVPLPAGVYLGFSDTNIKTQVSAQGLAGVCGAGKGGETAILAGTCGTRTGWALAGDVPLGDLPIDAFAGGTENIKFDVVLARVLPIFRKFNSSIVRDVEFSLKNTPVDQNGAPQFNDAGTEDFTEKNHSFAAPGAVPLAFNFVNKIPDLPTYRGTPVDGVVLLGGANVPGRGVVPLGLGVALNTATPVDNKTDPVMGIPAGAGHAQLRMAPTHHGIEGSEYGVLALGVSFKAFTDSSAGIATSGIFVRPPANKLVFDPTGATPANILDMGVTGGFPKMPEGAKYNYATAAINTVPGRSFRIPGFTQTGNATTAIRVAFTDAFEHRWVVLADPAKALATGCGAGTCPGFTLPAAPGGTTDRTFANAAGTTRSQMLVQTIRLAADPLGAPATTLSYRNLVEASNTRADRLTEFTTAFSFIDYARPEISWKTPNSGMTGVMAGSNMVLVVDNFRVGGTTAEDGYVKVTLTGGTAMCQPAMDAESKMYSAMDKGEVSVALPAGCTGMVTATAKLVDFNGADLNPPVTSTRGFTIQ